MEIMKDSIKAILENIDSAQQFLDEESVDEFENIIMQVGLDLPQKRLP